jgi:hypothetical protein
VEPLERLEHLERAAVLVSAGTIGTGFSINSDWNVWNGLWYLFARGIAGLLD